jgi:hypothetical protein
VTLRSVYAMTGCTCLLALTTCTSRASQFVGRWQEIYGVRVVEFFRDNRVSIDGAAGAWTALEGGRVRIEVSVMGSALSYTARVQRDTLTLEKGGEASVYRRLALGAAPDSTFVFKSAMKSVLRNLIVAQERYFAENVKYSGSVSSLFLLPSSGVSVTIGTASGTGWNATASHAGTSMTCGVFVGSAPAPVQGQNEGAPECR